MDYTTLIDRILEAEQSARCVTQEAKEKQANLDAELETLREETLHKYRERADVYLSQLRDQELETKERTIAALDRRLAEAREKMERAYTRYGDNWVDTLFHQTVDLT